MMKFLRSQSQMVLVVVLGVIAVGFLFYGNAGNLLTAGAGRGSNDYGSIDGEDLSLAELSGAVHTARNFFRLTNQQPSAAEVAQIAWTHLLLAREAEKLHVTVTEQEVIDYISKMPTFQKDGAFSVDLYHQQLGAMQNRLRLPAEAGANPAAAAQLIFEDLIRNDIRYSAVSDALFSTVRSSTRDVSQDFAKYNGLTTVSYVLFDPKAMASQVQVTPADIEAEYKNNPTNPAYRTKEKRKVDFVLFTLSPDQAKLPEDQKNSAREALGQKALDFILAFQPDPSAAPGASSSAPDFQAEARKRGLNPMTTDYFTDDSAPANVPPSPAFNQAAFALTKEDPVSKVVEMSNGVAVLHLSAIQPNDLRPLDQVKADIQKQLLETKSRQSAQVAADNAAKQLQEAVGKGADFRTAAAGLKFKVETIPAFVPKQVGRDPKQLAFARAAISLETNGVSSPVQLPGEDLIAVVHLDSRTQPDPAGLTGFEKEFRETQDARLRKYVTEDWVNWRGRQPGTRPPAQLEAFGNVE